MSRNIAAKKPMMRLTRKAFSSSLRKGLGRALLYANQYGIDAVNDIVLDACLHNLSYDRQCESSRARWLLCFFNDTLYYDAFRASLINALDIEKESYDLYQICDLLKEMAVCGDRIAKQALGRYVKRQVRQPSSDDIGMDEWIELEGVKGLLVLARLFGRRLQKDPQYSPYWPRFNEAQADQILKKALFKAAQQEPVIRIYLNYLKKTGAFKPFMTPAEQNEIRKNRRRTIRRRYPFAGIVHDAQNGVGDYPGHYVTFGKYATAKELEKIYGLVINESNDSVRMRLLWIFRRTSLPRVDKRILRWADGPHEGLRSAAIGALSQVSDPRIHKLAKAKLKAGKLLGADNEVLDLFLNCYHCRDAGLITRSLYAVRPDAEEAHCLGLGIIVLAERYNDPLLENALRWTYENMPCTNCRSDAVIQLDRIGRLDADTLQECLYDAHEDTRAFAAKGGGV